MSRELTVRQLRNARQIPARRDASDTLARLPLIALAALLALAARIIDAV
jgi:hypothetical protein